MSQEQQCDKHWRKKPVVIEAVQWDESMTTLLALRAKGLRWVSHDGHVEHPDLCRNLRIRTLEDRDDGAHHVSPGDWIIKGVAGEFYACKPDIFAATYEPAFTRSHEQHTEGRWCADMQCAKCYSADSWRKSQAACAPSTTRRSDCPLENCEKTGQCEFPQDCDAPSPATPRSGETPIADAAGLWLMAEGPLPADWKCPPGQEADIRRFDHELLGPCTEWKVVTAAVARRLERKLAEAMNRCDEALEGAEAAVRQRDSALSTTPRIDGYKFYCDTFHELYPGKVIEFSAVVIQEMAERLSAGSAIACTHVICFEGEGAEVLLCRGWDDCREQFFNGIFGDGHHDWDEAQVKLWDADFANDDSWSRDENGKRSRFTADVGEISKVRIYAINAADGTAKP